MTAPWMKGLKPKDPVGFDLGAAAAGVADELELQGVRQADFVGVSVGASVALRLAVERPELVGRLVLGGALVRPSKGALRMQRLAMRLVPEGKLVDAGVSRPRMLAVLDALKGFDGTESLRTITAPVLLVAGSKDKAGIAAAQELSKRAADRAPAGHRRRRAARQHRVGARARRPHPAFLDEPTRDDAADPGTTTARVPPGRRGVNANDVRRVRRRGAGAWRCCAVWGAALGTTTGAHVLGRRPRPGGRRRPVGPVRGAPGASCGCRRSPSRPRWWCWGRRRSWPGRGAAPVWVGRRRRGVVVVNTRADVGGAVRPPGSGG